MVTKKKKGEFQMTESNGLSFTALKDHRIVHNGTDLSFVKGEQYESVDSKWEATLKAEKVI